MRPKRAGAGCKIVGDLAARWHARTMPNKSVQTQRPNKKGRPVSSRIGLGFEGKQSGSVLQLSPFRLKSTSDVLDGFQDSGFLGGLNPRQAISWVPRNA